VSKIDRRKESIDQRRKSEKSKPNEETLIDESVCVRADMCQRERERYCSSSVAYVPIHMIIDEGREREGGETSPYASIYEYRSTCHRA
jgi:hypothetical protein